MNDVGASHIITWHFENDTSNLSEMLAQIFLISNKTNQKIRQLVRESHGLNTQRPAGLFAPANADVLGACWHNGNDYEYVLIGDASSVMQYCDLSSGEHEAIILRSRTMGVTDVYAIASVSSHHFHQQLEDLHKHERLVIRGLVAL